MRSVTLPQSTVWHEWREQWDRNAPLNWNKFKTHMGLHWLSYLLMAVLLWILHLHYQFGIGLTDSLPYRFYVAKRDAAFAKGDYVVYSYGGEYQGYDKKSGHQFFIKKIVGVPGDVVYTEKNPDQSKHIWVSGLFVGKALVNKFRRLRDDKTEPLHAIADQVIPVGYYYGYADHPHSFDSRYASQGLIPHKSVVAKVIWAW